MALPSGLLLLLLLSPRASFGVQQSSASTDQRVRKVGLTRTLHIPAIKVIDNGDPTAAARGSSAMAIWPGGNDEPPEGPTGFDVFDDGTLVITNPLLKKLSWYDAQGTFKRSWDLDFSPDSVSITRDNLMSIHDAKTGEVHTLDREGKAHPAQTASSNTPLQAKVLSGKEGVISAPASNVGTIRVRFDDAASSLLSLEVLDTGSARGTFVALEATATGGEPGSINLKKMVRLYSPTGALQCESSEMPLDYYVLPVDELRVRNGIIYQLMTTSTEVRINEWKTE
jgi:hypothetical protein